MVNENYLEEQILEGDCGEVMASPWIRHTNANDGTIEHEPQQTDRSTFRLLIYQASLYGVAGPFT